VNVLVGWCAQCGMVDPVDDDGACPACGCDASGGGADQAIAAVKAVKAMRAEADKWASMGWRDMPEQDAALAAGCNRAAEAILAAGGGE